MNDNLCYVRTSQDTLEIFNRDKIVKTLLRETKIDVQQAIYVAELVHAKLLVREEHLRSTSLVRELVNVQLTEMGLIEERNAHTRVGIPVYNISSAIQNGSKDNANMIHNPETVHKHVADVALKEYALLHCIPEELAKLHMKGYIHIHDLEFFATRPMNCMQHNLGFFIRNGLKVDGTGEHTSIAKPPKHLETLMNHSGEILLAAQQHMSGGQSFSLWNVFVAPFAKGRTYDEVKQAMEMFIFNLNMAYAARGSQVPFTSVNLEFTVPDIMKDEPAYGPSGELVGVYGDFEEETRMVQRAFTDVLIQGDAHGKPHLFPNTIYVLRKEMMKPEFEEDVLRVHELMAKFGTPYFLNMLPKWRGSMANAMGCRTGLNDNYTGNWQEDCLRTGNLAYISINLPRLAYEAKGDDSVLFDGLLDCMEASTEIMRIRREHAEKCLTEYNLLPFLAQTGEGIDGTYYSLKNTTMGYGILGMNEMLQAHTGDGIVESQTFGLSVARFMNEEAKRYHDEDGLRYTVLQSPAESTVGRFAALDLEHYGEDEVIHKGPKTAPYYTNSTHVPVDADILLPERIKIESKFHPLTTGGHIFHAWMGESYSSPESLMSLTDKISRKSDMGFWAYSSIISSCLTCNTVMKGKHEKCVCGSEDIEWYDRVTGYVQQIGRRKGSIGGWNKGKVSEFNDRRRY